MIGIYAITNAVTGQRYIGQSVKARARIGQHFGYLRRGIHENVHMQRSFDKYGREAFSGLILLSCRRLDLAFYEHLLIKGFRSDQRALGFNMTVAIEGGILTHTPEAKAAIAEFNRTRPKYERTPEIRAKTAATLTGRVGPNKGRTMSPEWRAKLAARKVGNQHRRGKTFTPESRAKISASLRARAQG